MKKAHGSDEIPAELFQIQKDAAAKVQHSMCQHIWKTQLWLQDWRRSVFLPILKKGNARGCSDCQKISLISHASKVRLNILQARLQRKTSRFTNWIQKRQRNQRSNFQHLWIKEKTREFQKYIYFNLIDYAKAFDCVDHHKLENSSRDGNTRPELPLEKCVCRSGNNSQNWTWDNRLVLNTERNTSRLYVVTMLI